MRKTAVGEPEALRERSCVGHESIAFPSRCGVPVVGGSNVVRLGIFAPVEPDDTPIAVPARGHDKDPLPVGLLDDLDSIAILKLPRAARREAIRHGIVLQEVALAILVQRFGPGLKLSDFICIGDVRQHAPVIHADVAGASLIQAGRSGIGPETLAARLCSQTNMSVRPMRSLLPGTRASELDRRGIRGGYLLPARQTQ